jgi:phage-related protein
MSTLENLKCALTEIAALTDKRNALAEAREHLTAQDKEMFNRIFDKIEATECLTLKERTVVIERTKHDGATRSVLGLRVEAPPRRRKAISDPRKKRDIPDGPSVDGLQGVHARLRDLRASLGNRDAAPPVLD